MNYRAKKVIKNTIILLITGLAYAGLCSVIGVGIPCPIHFSTGLYCPSCGVSRMLLNMLKLDFKTAFRYNQCLFCTLPIIILITLSSIIKYIKTGQTKLNRFELFLCILIIIILIIFGILRNIPAYSYLRPPS